MRVPSCDSVVYCGIVAYATNLVMSARAPMPPYSQLEIVRSCGGNKCCFEARMGIRVPLCDYILV